MYSSKWLSIAKYSFYFSARLHEIMKFPDLDCLENWNWNPGTRKRFFRVKTTVSGQDFPLDQSM